MNVGLSDSGLLTHLSEATAGSLSGIGHSTVYEELATYSFVSLGCIQIGNFSDDGHSLAVNYLFMTDHGSNEHPELVVHDFDANTELNDYEVSHANRLPSPLSRIHPSIWCFLIAYLSHFFTDPLGVTRFDSERGRGTLLQKRFCEPAQHLP
jgi:hypothetical protein